MSNDIRPPIPQFHCECCGLPLVFEKTRGVGYVCERCKLHYDDGWRLDSAGLRPQRDVDHELMSAVWWALVDVESNGPLADAIRKALPDGQADL